jgi:hypothetical protein
MGSEQRENPTWVRKRAAPWMGITLVGADFFGRTVFDGTYFRF